MTAGSRLYNAYFENGDDPNIQCVEISEDHETNWVDAAPVDNLVPCTQL